MAAGGNPLNVDLGPGRLYVAPIDTTDPVNASAALPSAWVAIGYTEDGTSIETQITSQAVEVAEELDPISYEQTARMTKVQFQMAEATAKNLALALGAGLTVASGAVTFDAPDAGSIVAVKFVWDSDEDPTSGTNRRHLFRKCTPSGTISLARKKAPQKALVAAAFDCAKPDSSTSAWTVFSNASGQI